MASFEHEPPKRTESALRKLLPVTTAGILIAGLYAGYTIYSRHAAAVDAEKRAEETRQAQEQQADAAITNHGELSIITFGADAGVLRPGEKTELCYGVLNAKSVKLDPPPVEETKPSYRHCLEIAPKKTTTYTLTATSNTGQTKTSSFTIQIH